MNRQKTIDYADILMNLLGQETCSDLDADLFLKILHATDEGHNGCICTIIPEDTQRTLQLLGFHLDEETEGDDHYWIVSWQNDTMI